MDVKHRRFVKAYLGPAKGNATQAAIAAGYSSTSAHVTGCRLLKREDIRQLIGAKLDAEELTPMAIRKRMSEIAMMDVEFKGTDAVHCLKALADIHKLTSKHDQGAVNIQVNIGYMEDADTEPTVTIEAEQVKE